MICNNDADVNRSPLRSLTLMKEPPFLIAMGLVFLALVVSGALRGNKLRSDAKAARDRQAPTIVIPPPDPVRFSHLRIAKLGQDAAPMVFIPGGKIGMGTKEEVGEFDEKPFREVTIKSYFIDLYEISNAQYQQFIEKTNRTRQEIMVFLDDTKVLLDPPDFPAVGVSWFDAHAYCIWDGKRLPSEAEWEHAARGDDLRQWPWGNKFLDGYANLRGEEDGFAYTAPVGHFEAGRSPFGLYDMAGNVSEWVFDWYDEFFYRNGQVTLPRGPDSGIARVVRGGSWDQSSGDVRTTKRQAIAPYRKEATVGFRCAMDAPEDPPK